MSGLVEIFIAILALFFVGGTIIAFASRRFLGAGSKEFFVGGYRVGGFIAAMTYAATTYSAFMMIGLAGLTFETGIASLGFELSYLASTVLILATIGVVIWSEARRRGWVSPSEMIADLYGSKYLGMAIAILYLFALVPYTSAQLKGIGEIFDAIGVGYQTGVIFAAIATGVWTAIAGLWSVATTDAYQGIWMILSSTALTIWLFAYLLPANGVDYEKFIAILSGANSKNQNLFSFTWGMHVFIGFTIPWIFFALTNPQVVQRLYIPRDEKAYRRMLRLFSVYGFLYTLLCVFLGLGYRAFLESVNIATKFFGRRDAVAPYVISLAHPVLASFVYVSIVAAAISTADSIILSVASSITRDFYERVTRRYSERGSKIVTYTSITLLLALATAFALSRVGYIVELSVSSSAYLLPLAPMTIAGLVRKKRSPWRGIASLIAGEAVALYSIITCKSFNILTATPVPRIPIPIPLWILIASTIPVAIP